MFRPEQMSKVSVAGSEQVMDEVIETIHELNLVHVVDYDDSWEGFHPGDSQPEAEPLSETLVTVRSIESILDIDEEDAGPSRIVTDEEIEAEIAEVRARVNELDDRRVELREERRDIDDRLDSVRPFAQLGIDLDLLSGYDSLETSVVEGSEQQVNEALSDAEGIDEFETFAEDGIVAIFVYPDEDREDVLEDALVGIEATVFSVPDAESSPEEYVADLEARREEIDSKLADVEDDIEELKRDVAGFLLAVEEQLSIDVQKAEVPLSFATTERSFIAEGWILSDRYPELESALVDAVGDRVVVEELERVDHDGHSEAVAGSSGSGAAGGAGGAGTGEQPAAADGSGDGEVRADGGDPEDPSMHEESPPVVLDNADPARPFEMLVNLVNRPKYTELDPTLLVFLTFPFAFGFMIGDIGYGLLYMAMGAFMYRFDSEAIQALGAIALWAGGFTILFGYLYDDIFGVHMADMGIHLPLAGVVDKGLQLTEFALLWLVVSILFGILHLSIGFVMGFVNDLHHGVREATLENLSWLIALNGFFVWVFSTQEAGTLGAIDTDLTAAGSKPDFLVGTDGVLFEFLGFPGFSETVGVLGLALLAIGVVMIGIGEGGIGLIETPTYILGHSISYLRITAVLLAKAGMAFVVNLLVFGGYATEDGYTYFHLPGTDVSGLEQEFVGLIHMDPLILTIPAAVLVFVFGHILVLLLGITAAGIQMIRLEYVEFFQKFYEGGGEEYKPFGYDRTHTSE